MLISLCACSPFCGLIMHDTCMPSHTRENIVSRFTQVVGTREGAIVLYGWEGFACVAEGRWALGPVARVVLQPAGVRWERSRQY